MAVQLRYRTAYIIKDSIYHTGQHRSYRAAYTSIYIIQGSIFILSAGLSLSLLHTAGIQDSVLAVSFSLSLRGAAGTSYRTAAQNSWLSSPPDLSVSRAWKRTQSDIDALYNIV